MVRAEPETAVRTNPPAVVNAIVEMGSGRRIGAGAAVEKETRQAAIAKMIKPINFMIKLLVVVLSVWYCSTSSYPSPRPHFHNRIHHRWRIGPYSCLWLCSHHPHSHPVAGQGCCSQGSSVGGSGCS
eukprot:TRINITY_DN55_c0_g1_i7.p1 TRINITY_DN55_c0_g1~~TRINITY_DN55_c0_g1_i7.p1  ORF type:complete len:127 (+),score=16.79 TRINITY_DN55_c0_g1_i7:131-511(+)